MLKVLQAQEGKIEENKTVKQLLCFLPDLVKLFRNKLSRINEKKENHKIST